MEQVLHPSDQSDLESLRQPAGFAVDSWTVPATITTAFGRSPRSNGVRASKLD